MYKQNNIINRTRLTILIVCVAFVCFGSPALAATHHFNFPLEGGQEAPPNGSPGNGFCGVTLDTVSGSVTVSCTYSDLLGEPSISHLHGLAEPGTNAAVIFKLDVTGVTSGLITGNAILTGPQVTGMLDGLTYINLHTDSYPGGEIRGQVVNQPTGSYAVPTVPFWALITMVFLMLVFGTFVEARRVKTDKNTG